MSKFRDLICVLTTEEHAYLQIKSTESEVNPRLIGSRGLRSHLRVSIKHVLDYAARWKLPTARRPRGWVCSGDVGDGPCTLIDLSAVTQEEEIPGSDDWRKNLQLPVHLRRSADQKTGPTVGRRRRRRVPRRRTSSRDPLLPPIPLVRTSIVFALETIVGNSSIHLLCNQRGPRLLRTQIFQTAWGGPG